MLPHLVRAFQGLPRFRSFVDALPTRGAAIGVGGLPGGSVPVLLASLVQHLPQRSFLVVAPGPSEAERWLADLSVLLDSRVRLYPQREAFGEEEPHFEIAGERVETVEALINGDVSVVVTTTRAIAELTAMPAAVRSKQLRLAVGDDSKPADAIDTLERMGYERRPTVLDVAQFAVRGGILDVYGFGMAAPMRIEWWGDEIISIRAFDLDTQRSESETESVTVLPVAARGGGSRESGVGDRDPSPIDRRPADARQSLLDLVPPDTLVFIEQGVSRAEVDRMWSEAEHHLEVARRLGEDVPERGVLYVPPSSWEQRLGEFARLQLGQQPYDFDFRLSQPEPVERAMKRLASIIAAGPTLVLCDNEGQLERLEELLSGSHDDQLPANLTLAIGALHAGFVIPGLAVLTDHEIFRRARRVRRPRRYKQAMVAAAAGAMAPGDYVVHLDYGIGIYRGTETLTTDAGTMEVAVLEYEGGDRLNVPLYKLDQL